MNPILKLQIGAFCLSACACFASNDDTLVRPLQDQWADIKYKQDAKQHADSYQALAEQAGREQPFQS